MRIFFTVFVMFLFTVSVLAKVPDSVSNNLPKGVFKKNFRGQVVQYDNKGKKTGIYEVKNGRFVKIK